ncbi:uncharacterized protein CEXT_714761 [Caerostris extrusa]|uniref:Uncharacterized protein n=1 Tax=Caerostris extrusa TaxID=172846 RepID=A0AAV4NLD8_CAEEX|nr:uncharacterized protein CEXT_714761 [Caerostris extrusa]
MMGWNDSSLWKYGCPLAGASGDILKLQVVILDGENVAYDAKLLSAINFNKDIAGDIHSMNGDDLRRFYCFLVFYCAFPYLSSNDLLATTSWKSKLICASCMWSSLSITADAVPNTEESAKCQLLCFPSNEKVVKGTQLLEDLNNVLELVKDNLRKGGSIDMGLIAKIRGIKETFNQLKMNPSDLSEELLENFKEKTFEAFRLILQGLNVDSMNSQQNSNPKQYEKISLRGTLKPWLSYKSEDNGEERDTTNKESLQI